MFRKFFYYLTGFYVFPEMANRIHESNYYGIPKNMDFDGTLPTGQLCQTHTRQGLRNPSMCSKYLLLQLKTDWLL